MTDLKQLREFGVRRLGSVYGCFLFIRGFRKKRFCGGL
jgi:hypothetical protein